MKILFVNSGRPRAFIGIQSSIIRTLITDFGCHIREITPEQFAMDNIEEVFNPDIILVFYGIFVPPEKVISAQNKGYKTVLWATEDPYQFDVYFKNTRKAYDIIFTNDAATIPYYKREHVYYIPACTDEKIHKPVKCARRYKSDICIIGQGFPGRIRILNSLVNVLRDFDVKIIGQWMRWDATLSLKLRKYVLPYVGDPWKVVQYYNGAKINLNIHREWGHCAIPENQNSLNIKAFGINSRVVDISACRAFQLVDNTRGNLCDMFEPDRQMVSFDMEDINDLKQKIFFYLKNEKVRNDIRFAAYQQAIGHHTYAHRLKYILDTI